MSERLGPGSTFAGCRLEAIAGRGGMGVVWRATQLALSRPVALKVIAPDWAADEGYRERFERESHLAAAIDHPNIIPVYEAGELDGRLYLLMRWVEGTDLGTVLSSSGRLSPGRAIGLLRPVASALAVAHRRGLIHRDIKPGNVLIARSDDDDEDQIYLTDFGIARQTEGESITRTGVLVGTIDYMAPERLEGGKGDAASDIYAFGCMLFEVLTGHVPFDRPTAVSKIFAHINDPTPSAADEVNAVPEQLDAIVSRAMAKRPEDRFESARALVVALDQALQELDTAGRAAVPRAVQPDTSQTAVALTRTEPERMPTAPTMVLTPPATRSGRRRDMPTRRRSPILWLAPIALLAIAALLIAILTRSSSPETKIHGTGLSEGLTVAVPGTPGSISVGSRNVWISVPEHDELVRFNRRTGERDIFRAANSPTAMAAGFSALWVAETASRSLAQFNGDSGRQLYATPLRGTPTAVTVDQHDSSAWVADSSGAISHVALGGEVIGNAAHAVPAATSIAWGEGWLWATTNADPGLVRVSLGTAASSRTFDAGPHPVAVALDLGVWTAHTNGQVTRFNPQSGQLRVNARTEVASELDSIAATEGSPFVWAISKSAKTLYRITNDSEPAVTGTVAFSSTPIALATRAGSVWVATEDGKAIEIRF